VIDTIENLGTDSTGKYRRPDGKTTTFSLRACPPSVEIGDEAAIPLEFKVLLLKLPALRLEQLLDGLEIERRAMRGNFLWDDDGSVDQNQDVIKSVVLTLRGRTQESWTTLLCPQFRSGSSGNSGGLPFGYGLWQGAGCFPAKTGGSARRLE
jgi:hypothetical protein